MEKITERLKLGKRNKGSGLSDLLKASPKEEVMTAKETIRIRIEAMAIKASAARVADNCLHVCLLVCNKSIETSNLEPNQVVWHSSQVTSNRSV